MVQKPARRFARRVLRRAADAMGYDLVRRAETGPRDLPEGTHAYQKIFGIGMNKTGTTSLEAILKTYGFRMPRQTDQERLLTRAAMATDYHPLRALVAQFDAFQDYPFSYGNVFAACDALFPESRFILTIRDEDAWYQSLYRFHQRKYGFTDRQELDEAFFKGKTLYLEKDYTYHEKRHMVTELRDGVMTENWSLLYDPSHYMRIYRNRNENILRYFKDRPDKLLVIDLTKEADTSRICQFLGLPRTAVMEVPHANRT